MTAGVAVSTALRNNITMFASPFGTNFSFVVVTGDIQPSWQLLPEEQALISGSKSIRYLEDFIRGRTAARRALSQLGFADPFPILRGDAGQPLWPPGIVGSISHSGATAVAVATSTQHAAGVGIDIQDLRRKPTQKVASFICLESERNWIEEHGEFRNERLLRIFSAKESIFKAVYPICGVYFGFHAAILKWLPANSRFLGTLTRDLQPPFLQGFTFDVPSLFSDNMVFSYTIIPPK